MSVIFIALPAAIVIAAAALLAFAWAVREGQYDDVDTPAVRMLYDDEPVGAGVRRIGERNENREPSRPPEAPAAPSRPEPLAESDRRDAEPDVAASPPRGNPNGLPR